MSVTVTYDYPTTASSTTPPTAAQAANTNAVTGTVTATTNTDTSAVIQHNWNLSTAQENALQPFVRLIPLIPGFYGATPFVTFTNGNEITITLSGTGYNANPMFAFVIERPHSFTMDGNVAVPSN